MSENQINSSNIYTNAVGDKYSLSIVTLLEYNETTVQCVATFLDGSPPLFTPPVTLLIQGTILHLPPPPPPLSHSTLTTCKPHGNLVIQHHLSVPNVLVSLFEFWLSSSDTPGKVKNSTCERSYSTSANTTKALLTTHWSSLFSLDLNNTDPDIVYSVELYKISRCENVYIMSHENMSVNNTNYAIDPMEIYKVIITARNNVEGARNGTSVEIRGE